MGVVVCRDYVEAVSQARDPKQAILTKVGDLQSVRLLWNFVLVAIYIRPEKTRGGILRPHENLMEDLWQGKVGLMLKHGPSAYTDGEYAGQRVDVGEWCAMKIQDTWQCEINGVPCRVLEDFRIRMVLDDPNIVF
jgi:hypothetical protein